MSEPKTTNYLTKKMIDGDTFFTDRFVTHLREELGLPLNKKAPGIATGGLSWLN